MAKGRKGMVKVVIAQGKAKTEGKMGTGWEWRIKQWIW